jgi:hypothetical protein
MGKIKGEGVGEVQEFIDILDYSVGLSRMLNEQLSVPLSVFIYHVKRTYFDKGQGTL